MKKSLLTKKKNNCKNNKTLKQEIRKKKKKNLVAEFIRKFLFSYLFFLTNLLKNKTLNIIYILNFLYSLSVNLSSRKIFNLKEQNNITLNKNFFKIDIRLNYF